MDPDRTHHLFQSYLIVAMLLAIAVDSDVVAVSVIAINTVLLVVALRQGK